MSVSTLNTFDVAKAQYKNKPTHQLLGNGAKTQVHYPIPTRRQKPTESILAGNYPVADELHATELSLPSSYGHTVEDIASICKSLRQAPQSGREGGGA